MTIMNKKKQWKYLRVQMHEEDWRSLNEQAEREHLSLATWCRQKLLQLLDGRAFNED